jgi:hypothetical protein
MMDMLEHNGGARALELVVKMMKERVPSAITTQMMRSSQALDNAECDFFKEHKGM